MNQLSREYTGLCHDEAHGSGWLTTVQPSDSNVRRRAAFCGPGERSIARVLANRDPLRKACLSADDNKAGFAPVWCNIGDRFVISCTEK